MAPLRILCVDDEPLALDQIKDVLSKIDTPFDGQYFGSPTRAIEAQLENPADIVISDLKMGTTDGLAVITTMRKTAPKSIYMLLTAQADLESALIAVNEVRVFRFLTKPARVPDIQEAISCAIVEREAAKLGSTAKSTLSAIEKKHTAVATIDLNGKIIFSNLPANEIFSDKSVFSIAHDNTLRSVDGSTTKNFQRFLTELASATSHPEAKNLFRFARLDGGEPVMVSAVFFDADDGTTPHFSLFISDPTRRDFVTAASIATALRLTKSEARIVHGLIVGGGVAEAAGHAGVSLSTARSYLRDVFQKTGVSRQADLVRLAILSAA